MKYDSTFFGIRTEESTTPATVDESKVVADPTEESRTKPTDDPADGTANDGTTEDDDVAVGERSTSQAPKEEKVSFFKRLFACGATPSKPQSSKAIEETPPPDEEEPEKEDIPLEGAPSLEEKKSEDAPTAEETKPEEAEPELMEVEAPKEVVVENSENVSSPEKTEDVDTKSLVCGCL
jgi:hypothetical protein